MQQIGECAALSMSIDDDLQVLDFSFYTLLHNAYTSRMCDPEAGEDE